MAQSYKEYIGGELSTKTYNVPFKYISINDVNALGFDGEKWTPLTVSSRDHSANTITLSTAPSALYTTLRLYRATSNTQLVDFQNGSRLSESDLDTAYQQGLFAAQEIAEDASTTQFAAVRAAGLQTGTSLSNFASEDFTGDGTSTAFNITEFNPQTTVNEAYRVSIDGVMQSPVDAYSITLTPAQITFASAPPSGSKIVVVTAASAASAVSVDDATIGLTSANKAEIKDLGVTNAKLAGSITQDKLAGGIPQSKLSLDLIDDDTMTTGVSATSLASSESIKAYVDNNFQARAGCVYDAKNDNILYSNGISGIVRNSTGNYTVTLSNAAPSAYFPVFANAQTWSGAERNYSTGAKSTSTTTIDVYTEASNGTAFDLEQISIVAHW
jgi:hypothetical protein